MALQTFANGQGELLTPHQSLGTPTIGNTTMDAVGESVSFIGNILWTTGPGSSKTVSSAGGKIHHRFGAVTLADAATVVRVGLQDVTAGGQAEDGTFDVSGDWTSAAAPTANAVNTKAMGTGTKTLAHGDLVAVVIEMTARGGTDSVQGSRFNDLDAIRPYALNDVGSGPVAVSGGPLVTIEADDGTMGWLGLSTWVRELTTVSVNSGSTPDEYALIFQIPFKAQAVGLWAAISGLASTEDFELILYSDPLGTPVAERTLTFDADARGAATEYVEMPFTSGFTLSVNTNYAVAYRPTTTGATSLRQHSFGAGNGNLRKPTALGTNWRQGTRTDQTGAFTEDTTILPGLGVYLAQLSDDVGAGGGSTVLHGVIGS